MPEINPIEIVPKFDVFLFSRKTNFEAVIIGAGALNVMKVITRHTIDLDILAPEIPLQILKLAREFKEEIKTQGIELIDEWINNGPKSLLKDLPQDWETRKELIFKGKSLILYTLGRPELLKSKLFPYCDRDERDFDDLVHLAPTKTELLEAIPWLEKRDLNPDWPNHVSQKLKQLAKALGYELY